MKRSLLILAVSLLPLLFASCQRELCEPEGGLSVSGGSGDVFRVCVSMPDACEESLRTTLGTLSSGVYPTLWAVGDKISVGGVLSAPLTAEEASGKQASFTFQGAMSAPYNYLYPATEEKDLVSFPENQLYCEGTFDPSAMPMWASSVSYDGVTMQHLGAVLRFSFSSASPVVLKKLLLMSQGGEPLAGTFRMRKDADGRFTGDMDPVAVSTVITMWLPEDGMTVGPEQKDFYLCVPGAAYSQGLKLAAYSADGKYMLLKFKTGEGNHQVNASSFIGFPTKALAFTDGPRLIAAADDWNAFASAINDGALPVSSVAQIVNDLDFTGKELVSITKGFTGTISGQKSVTENYCIKNCATANLNRIVNYNASGTISHIDIDASCTYKVDAWDGSSIQFFALLCGQNRGTIEYCKASHTMRFALPVAGTLASYYAGLVGRNHGTISHCEFAGTMVDTETTSDIPVLSHLIGGIVANNYNKQGDFTGPGEVSDCVFSGKILLGPAAGTDSQDCSGPAVAVSSGTDQLVIGGVCARYATGGSFTNNSSSAGAIIDVRGNYYNVAIGGVIGFHTLPLQDAASVHTNRASVFYYSGLDYLGQVFVGGVSGRSQNDLSYAVNEGTVRFLTDQSEAKTAVACGVGGVAGASYNTSVASRTFARNTNSGAVTIVNVSSTSPASGNDTMNKWSDGGIVGYTNQTLALTDCHNSGNITLTYRNAQASSKYRLTYTGGVLGLMQGTAGRIESCSSTGEIYLNTFSNYGTVPGDVLKAPYAGGIVGGIIGVSTSSRASILDCAVTGTNKISLFRGIAGGIAGYASYATVGSSDKPCSVSMSILGDSGLRTYSAGIVGAMENTEVAYCSFSGSISSVPKPAGIVGEMLKGGSIKECVFNGTIAATSGSYARDPRAIVSLINAKVTDDEATQASEAAKFNITHCGIGGTVEGAVITASNYASYLYNNYDGSNTLGTACNAFSYVPFTTDSGKTAAYLYTE